MNCLLFGIALKLLKTVILQEKHWSCENSAGPTDKCKLSCARGWPQKIFYDKNSPFPFSSQSRKLRFIEGHGLFSYFCSLLSFSLCFCPLVFHEHVKWNKFSSSLLYQSCQGVAYLWKCHVFVKLQMLMLRR